MKVGWKLLDQCCVTGWLCVDCTRFRRLLLSKFQLGHCGKGKAVLLQAWSGPEGSRKFRFPDFMTTAQDGGKVVSLTHRPPLPQGNAPGTHFGYRLSRPPGPYCDLDYCGTERNSLLLPSIEHFLNYLFGLSRLKNVTTLHCSNYWGQSFCIITERQLQPS